jgi:hypothetical protein
LELVNSKEEIRSRPELFNELERRPHRVKRRDLQNSWVAKVDHTPILVFFATALQARREPAGRENIPLTNVLGTLTPSERRLVESNVANEIEGDRSPCRLPQPGGREMTLRFPVLR